MEDETRKEATQEEKKLPEKPLDRMTAIELREAAMAIPGVSGVHAMKKSELLAVIREYYGLSDEEPGRRTKKAEADLPAPRELKARITELRNAKETAREGKDRKQVEVLRRRINRLRKLTRKAATRA